MDGHVVLGTRLLPCAPSPPPRAASSRLAPVMREAGLVPGPEDRTCLHPRCSLWPGGCLALTCVRHACPQSLGCVGMGVPCPLTWPQVEGHARSLGVTLLASPLCPSYSPQDLASEGPQDSRSTTHSIHKKRRPGQDQAMSDRPPPVGTGGWASTPSGAWSLQEAPQLQGLALRAEG